MALLSNIRATGVGPFTSAAINTVGASLIVVCCANYQGPNSISDSLGNTWTALTALSFGGSTNVQIFYCINPTTGASHTFSQATASVFGSILVQAWSGFGSFLAQSTGSASGTDTVQPGALSPVAGSLIVTTAAADSGGGGWTVNSGFTISNSVQFTGGVNDGGIAAYLISGGGSINPSLREIGTGGVMAAAIASFGVTASSTIQLSTLGAG